VNPAVPPARVVTGPPVDGAEGPATAIVDLGVVGPGTVGPDDRAESPGRIRGSASDHVSFGSRSLPCEPRPFVVP
jgi:hypothetical protein